MLVILLLLTLFFSQACCQNELEDYISIIDDVYGYEEVVTYDHYDNFTVHILNVTSQRWLNESYVNWERTIWWHYVGVIIPNKITVTDQAALFYVGGSSNRDTPPDPDDGILLVVGAVTVGLESVGVYLNNIPNQPLYFAADEPGKRRSNDPAIAFTMRQWAIMDNMTSPPELLLYFPMVKGGVRVVDAVVDYVGNRYGWSLDRWVVAGPSKWGWTAWLHAAMDNRVVGVIPMVMNLLFNELCMGSMHSSLGGWSFAMSAYWKENITTISGRPLEEMNRLMDPYSYRAKLTMPKLIIMGSSDEYFIPDNTWWWLGDMPGLNLIWLMENTDHIMIGHYTRLYNGIVSFFKGLHSTEYTFPNPTWTRGFTQTTGWLEMKSVETPREVVAWRANATDYEILRRDYRWFRAAHPDDPDQDIPDLNDVQWTEETVQQIDGQTWRVEFNNPPRGWEAFFMKMIYAGPEGEDFYVTTEVQITPDTYPFGVCEPGPDCKSVLV